MSSEKENQKKQTEPVEMRKVLAKNRKGIDVELSAQQGNAIPVVAGLVVVRTLWFKRQEVKRRQQGKRHCDDSYEFEKELEIERKEKDIITYIREQNMSREIGEDSCKELPWFYTDR